MIGGPGPPARPGYAYDDKEALSVFLKNTITHFTTVWNLKQQNLIVNPTPYLLFKKSIHEQQLNTTHSYLFLQVVNFYLSIWGQVKCYKNSYSVTYTTEIN